MTAIASALPAALATYFDEASSKVGERTRRHIGLIDERSIRRYARAIGDPNPIYHHRAAARAAGYDDIVAPPNMMAGIVEWGPGKPEEELGPDGTARQATTSKLRVMGAGERMRIMRAVTAGADVYEEVGVEQVEVKQGRSGPLLFVTSAHDFVDAAGEPYSRNSRTVMVRE